jgi:hypothetical protein
MAKKRTKSLPTPPPGPVLPPAPPTRKVRVGGVFKIIMSCVLVVGCVALVAWLGQLSSKQLGQRDRYRIDLASVQFDSPPTLDRASYLAEVRYISGLSDSIDSADPNLSSVLKSAFENHPWVEQMERVELKPNNSVWLHVRYRTPQLAILWQRDGTNETRAIDKQGVLLPVDANTKGLPVLLNERAVPSAEAGKSWPEAEVQRAVELCNSYPLRTVSRTKHGWNLVETSGKSFSINTP